MRYFTRKNRAVLSGQNLGLRISSTSRFPEPLTIPPTNQNCEPLYRFDLLMKWRGYLIVPVEYRGAFHCAIFNPFGQEMSSSVEPAASPEYIWAAGRWEVDRDIESAIAANPNLVQLLRQVGAI
jgi:hypothetical protein